MSNIIIENKKEKVNELLSDVIECLESEIGKSHFDCIDELRDAREIVSLL